MQKKHQRRLSLAMLKVGVFLTWGVAFVFAILLEAKRIYPPLPLFIMVVTFLVVTLTLLFRAYQK